ncbi:MAG: hypothetical protein ACR2NL_03205, partial [Acidimicrobiia bacterium]
VGDDSSEESADVSETFADISSGLADAGATEPTSAAAGADDGASEDAALDAPPAAFFQSQAEKIKGLRSSGQSLEEETADAHQECIDESGLEGFVAIEKYSIESGEYVAAVPVDAPDDSDEISFVDLDSCEIVYPED